MTTRTPLFILMCMKNKLSSLSVLALVSALLVARCASAPRSEPGRRPSAASARGEANKHTPSPLDSLLHELGLNVYYANLHAHHYMEYRASARSGLPSDVLTPGKCEGMSTFPHDDGRPCRTGASGENEVVFPDSHKPGQPIRKLDYFTMACDYARSEGGLDILFVTPHSKSGVGDGDTDTMPAGFAERHALLAEINRKYGGDFYCGLGQEASSISKGNHVNIFGHFLTTNADSSSPLFFPAGAFDRFYPQVQARVASGERLILQFNHPDIGDDMYWGPLSAGLKKNKLNDYGIDDFPPIACLHSSPLNRNACAGEPAPEALDRDLLKRTFANIREAGGDAYRLVEVTETSGATTNSGFDFRRIHKRTNDGRGDTRIDDGLFAYIFFLDMGFKIAPTANQDNHFYNYGSAIASRTGVLAPSLAESDVINALDRRLTFATEDRNSRLLLAARVAGKAVAMGQDIHLKDDSLELNIGYSDSDNEGPADLRVYYYHEADDISYDRKQNPWGAIRTIQFEGKTPRLPTSGGRPMDLPGALLNGEVYSLRIPIRKGRSHIFVEATQGDRDKMWSAPLFIRAD